MILSDGARWINKLAQTQYPKASLILDWWHLKRRVWQTVRGLPDDGLSSQDGLDWGRQWIDRLWRGQVTETLKSILVLASQLGGAPLDQPAHLAERSLPALHQFISNNQAAMIDYHRFQQAGYCIGSAVVEKAVDLLVCRRLKLRGQNWSRTGADRLLCWRQLILNDQWDEYWQPTQSSLRLNSHPGTLFLTLTKRPINTIIGHFLLNWSFPTPTHLLSGPFLRIVTPKLF